FTLSIMLIVSVGVIAQVGITNSSNNTNFPESSAILELKSDNKGLLFPRVNLQSDTDVATVLNPAQGLCIYNVDDATDTQAQKMGSDIFCWNGTSWRRVRDAETYSYERLLNGNDYTLDASNLKALYGIEKTVSVTLPTGIVPDGTRVQFYMLGGGNSQFTVHNAVTSMYGNGSGQIPLPKFTSSPSPNTLLFESSVFLWNHPYPQNQTNGKLEKNANRYMILTFYYFTDNTVPTNSGWYFSNSGIIQ
ncbi:MAG: hypothetical protein ACK5MD_10945, partial [Flavobacteriales bacterium]